MVATRSIVDDLSAYGIPRSTIQARQLHGRGKSMRIHFHGAAGDVTGSAYHVVTNKASILVDCGFFQGRKEESAKNRRNAKLEGGKLDAVVLTHGHLDHIGRLPLLTRNGYNGPIYATRPTIDIATLILKDSLMLQKQDLKRQNQKRLRSNHRSMHDTAIEGREIIAKAIENKAKVLVPVFAVGRTQLLLYLLAGASRGERPELGDVTEI